MIDFDQKLQHLLDQISEYYPRFDWEDQERVRQAFYFGLNAHGDQKRYSGEPYFVHPITATEILLQIQPDIQTIQACLLHDVVEDTEITLQQIEQKFGSRVRFLCEAVEKVSQVRLQNKEREIETLKKLFIGMAEDIRVIFIKLADRIHNLQTLHHIPREKQQRIAQESLHIYAPIADKLNLHVFKNQIEDWCFQYIFPDIYADLSHQMDKLQTKQQKIIDQAIRDVESELTADNIQIEEVQGRTKHLYSVYRKMQKKNFTTLDEVYDLFAIRIITQNQIDCYRALGALHRKWKPINARFKDHIAVPKPNGYQSLHTTLLGLHNEKNPTEIQIRTLQMHLDAEYGPAAHWAYKAAGNDDFSQKYIDQTEWLPSDIKDIQSNENEQEIAFQKMSESIRQGRIIVFTPRGEGRNLPEKATPIDFAYAIHTEVGHSAIGAKVNGHIRPLDSELSTGDVVEIMTKKGRQPNPLWLNFVKSSMAKGQIKTHLNRLKRDSQTDLNPVPHIEQIQKQHKAGTRKSLFAKTFGPKTTSQNIMIGGQSDVPYRLAKCCQPKPGNPIVAYISRGLQFVIHKQDCEALDELENNRFIEAHWLHTIQLKITGKPRLGLNQDISRTLTQFHALETQSQYQQNPDTNLGTWSITIEIPSQKNLPQLTHKLQSISDIKTVEIH